MSVTPETLNVVRRLNRVAQDLKQLFSRRDTAIDLMKLALVCHEHILLLGPPGSGKSELVARFAAGIKAQSFQYLLTRFTEPTELFGPIDLTSFQRGKYEVRTEGMLPAAQIAFLDEVFQASSAILNTLLSLVHERIFYNGAQLQTVPLISLFGASNLLPDDPTLRAFSDRFALRLEVEPVADESLGELLDKGWLLELERFQRTSSHGEAATLLNPEQINLLYQELPRIKIDAVYPLYQDVLRRLRAEGVELSERRMVKGLKLIRGAALLDGREEAENQDLWPLNHVWSSLDDRRVLRDIVQPLVEQAGGPSLETHRALEDITDELELLQSRGVNLQGDGAFTAHLSALAQLRRELMVHYQDEQVLVRRVESTIRDTLEAMQNAE